jgi:hypothetical protein
MTLGNMRELGVHNLIAHCLNNACRHQALIDVSSYPGQYGSAVVPVESEARQVWRSEQSD